MCYVHPTLAPRIRWSWWINLSQICRKAQFSLTMGGKLEIKDKSRLQPFPFYRCSNSLALFHHDEDFFGLCSVHSKIFWILLAVSARNQAQVCGSFLREESLRKFLPDESLWKFCHSQRMRHTTVFDVDDDEDEWVNFHWSDMGVAHEDVN